jgi:peptide/nickel transport system permease protein
VTVEGQQQENRVASASTSASIRQLAGDERRTDSRSFKNRAWRRLKQSLSAKIGLFLVLTMIVLAIGAPVIAPHDPLQHNTQYRLNEPHPYFPFGTDQFGRDVLSRVIYGSRISIQVGIISVLIASTIGGFLGLVAGYFGGWLDTVISRIFDIIFAFPAILLAIAVLAVLGPSLSNVMIAIGIVFIPQFGRIVRGPVLSAKNNEYVEASKVLGADWPRVLFIHVLPNVAAPLIVQGTIAFSFAILAEAGLSFLGLGAQPPQPAWGSMLSTGRQFIEIAAWLSIFPGLAIMLAVLGFNLIGDYLRDVLDPRMS